LSIGGFEGRRIARLLGLAVGNYKVRGWRVGGCEVGDLRFELVGMKGWKVGD
jgi:hypothetical protein